MTYPAPFLTTLAAMPEAARDALLTRAADMTSPAQLSTVAVHLLRGDADSAVFVASLPASMFGRYDAAMALAFGYGNLEHGGS